MAQGKAERRNAPAPLDQSIWVPCGRGVLTALIITLALVLLFALLLKVTGMSESMIGPVNQIIQIVSIFFGTMTSLKQQRNRGWMRGLLVGVLYVLLSFTLFSIFSGNWELGMGRMWNLVIGGAAGVLSGMMLVNQKKG